MDFFVNVICTIILILNIYPNCLAHKYYNDTKLMKQPGIYYESTGAMRIANSEWKMLTYVNLTNYYLKFEQIRKYHLENSQFCNQILDDKTKQYVTYEFQLGCLEFIHVSNVTMLMLEKKQRNLLHSMGLHSRGENRYKRGLINLGGKISKYLFGTLDADDADYYNEKISNLTIDAKITSRIINSQTHVIKSSLHALNETLSIINENENQLANNLNLLKEHVDNLTNFVNFDAISEAFSRHMSYFNLIVEQYRYELETLSYIIGNVHNGIAHSLLVSPTELLDEIRSVQPLLSKEVMFPVQATLEHMRNLYAISDLQIFCKYEKLIVVMIVPLITLPEYTLYKVLPLPVQYRESEYIFIKPEYDFLAVEKSKREYTTFTETQIQNCKAAMEFQICASYQPIYKHGENELCEMSLFKSSKFPLESCNIKFLKLTTSIWQKLEKRNSWLYVVPKPEDVFINCENERDSFHVTFIGVGVFTISPECTTYTSTSILIPTKTFYSKHYVDYVPSYDLLGSDHAKLSNFKILNLPDIKIKFSKDKIPRKLQELGQVSETLEHLQDIIGGEREKHTQKVNISMVMYVTVVLTFIISLYVIVKIVKHFYKLRMPVVNRARTPDEVEQVELSTRTEEATTTQGQRVVFTI